MDISPLFLIWQILGMVVGYFAGMMVGKVLTTRRWPRFPANLVFLLLMIAWVLWALSLVTGFLRPNF